jgi:divalent metal cation (Fe/Co/Zn/Cd) transporter
MLDGVDPEVIDEIRHAVNHTAGVTDISEVRVRWLGHRLHAELNIAVSPQLSVEKGHEIAKEVHHRLLHQLRYLSNATVHVDPVGASGEAYHRIAQHEHDDLAAHSH